MVRQCNPHPGAAFGANASDYVVRDVVVRRAKDGSDLRAIAAIAAEREVDDVVVGLPVGLSGREGPAAAAVRVRVLVPLGFRCPQRRR